MKHTQETKAFLSDIQKYGHGQKVKVNVDNIRDLIESDAVNRASVMATVSILAKFADKYPITFEDRQSIDTIIRTIAECDTYNVDESIKILTMIAGKYQ